PSRISIARLLIENFINKQQTQPTKT
ncbi:MAG: hypothetical protein ACD_75C01089G0001, partial [uncultured bacterium]